MSATQFGFSFDISRCSGCLSCIVACLDQNDLPDDGSRYRHVSRIEMGAYPNVKIRHVSLACMHCGEAPCIAVCPTRALTKHSDSGIVVVNEDLCIGCHSCATVCPFGAPQFPEGSRMSKCDFCVARVENGLEPACVRTCTTKALGFGPIEKLTEQQAKKASDLIVSSIRNGLVVVTSKTMKG